MKGVDKTTILSDAIVATLLLRAGFKSLTHSLNLSLITLRAVCMHQQHNATCGGRVNITYILEANSAQSQNADANILTSLMLKRVET